MDRRFLGGFFLASLIGVYTACALSSSGIGPDHEANAGGASGATSSQGSGDGGSILTGVGATASSAASGAESGASSSVASSSSAASTSASSAASSSSSAASSASSSSASSSSSGGGPCMLPTCDMCDNCTSCIKCEVANCDMEQKKCDMDAVCVGIRACAMSANCHDHVCVDACNAIQNQHFNDLWKCGHDQCSQPPC